MPNEELPDWVTETPNLDHSYQLQMMENNDCSIQEVDLTSEEYISLKQHLAQMRGYDVETT